VIKVEGEHNLMEVSPNLSVVLPAYNEEETISLVIERTDSAAKKTGLRYELLVVDDGSVDDTRQEVLRYSQTNGSVRLVGYTGNLGKGFALTRGFFDSLGDLIVFLDADTDVEPEGVVDFVDALQDADIVIASKRHPKSKIEVPFSRKLLSYGFNVFVRLVVGMDLKDTQTGLKAVRKSALLQVFPLLSIKRYAFDVELIAVSKLLNLRIVELPVKLQLTSGFKTKEIFQMLLDVLGIGYRLRIAKSYQRMHALIFENKLSVEK
jgi:glycosyltransferase involved in cell wall biosynthesis